MNNFYSSHFKYAIWLTAVSVATVIALSDVNTDCIAKNNGTLSNELLLGTWYRINSFMHIGSHPSCSCPSVTFTRPTDEELRRYREKYSSIDLPHAIGDDAVVEDKSYVKGLILGEAETKTFITDPDSVMRSDPEGYELYVFRRINDKYMLFWKCGWRGQVLWLFTRDPKAPEEEMQQIISDRPEITFKKTGIRYCNRTCY